MGAQLIAGGKKDYPQSTTAFAVTDMTADYALDCDTDADNAIADVLGTLIHELIRLGIIKGTITTH